MLRIYHNLIEVIINQLDYHLIFSDRMHIYWKKNIEVEQVITFSDIWIKFIKYQIHKKKEEYMFYKVNNRSEKEVFILVIENLFYSSIDSKSPLPLIFTAVHVCLNIDKYSDQRK